MVAAQNIQIRRAVLEDAELVLSLIDALADYEKLDPLTAEARQRLVDHAFGATPRIHPYIAELDGQPAAYAITCHSYSSFLAMPTLWLEDIFVLPEYRRAGIGSVFFEFLAAEALRQDCGRMEWAVLDWNQPAIDFYERMGGRRLSEWQVYRLTREQLESKNNAGSI